MYICWENGFESFDDEEIKEVYKKEVNKIEYPDFQGWLHDMLKMGILIKSD